MAKVRILHISDLQAGKGCLAEYPLEKSENPKGLYERYAEKLALDAKKTADGNIDIIVCTGDIAQFGLNSDYKMAGYFMDKLRTTLKKKWKDVLLVPGNHDVNYNNAKDKFKDTMGSSARFHPNKHLEIIKTAKMTSFKKWLHTIYKDTAYEYTPEQPIHFDKITNRNIVVVGLDTCETQTFRKKSDSGHIGAKQLEKSAELFSKYKEGRKIKIAIMHHNPFLDQTEQATIDDPKGVLESLRSQGVKIILAGHMHQGRLIENKSLSYPSTNAKNKIYILVTGPCCMTSEGRWFDLKKIKEAVPNRYQIITLDRIAGTAHLFFRKFTFERFSEPNSTLGAWTNDTELPYGGNNGETIIELPEIRMDPPDTRKIPPKIVFDAVKTIKSQIKQ